MIVMASLGSHGDLHPYLAVGLELKRRGHAVKIATVPYHRASVEALGFAYHALRPDIRPTDQVIVAMTMDPQNGPENIIRRVVMPVLRDTYADFDAACEGATLIINHTLNFSGPIVAERRGIPWVSTALAPIALSSVYDPPLFGGFERLCRLYSLGPTVTAAFFRGLKLFTSRWVGEYWKLRRELGLKPGPHPLFEGQHSPHLGLVMYSDVMGGPQPDWPASLTQTGFTLFDEPGAELSAELREFLAGGEPPIVFTLGTAAVHTAGDFYAESFDAVKRLGCRAVFLVGNDYASRRAGLESPRTFVTGYAPYALLFPRAAVVVHQGGIGTTAQALRSGRPMLVIPFGNDQSDNASRLVRQGVARSVLRHHYNGRRASFELRELLEDRRYSERAAALAPPLRAENGARAAADAIERFLTSGRRAG